MDTWEQKMALLVSCTEKKNAFGVNYEIEAIGGKTKDGICWKRSQAAAIAEIESGLETYYVNHNGSMPDIVVARTEGTKYLKTLLDRDLPAVLLALPDC
jgi:hypothetical protein